MTPLWHPHRFGGRAVAFYAVLALPLLRHLLRVGYPWWTAEVAVLLLVLALPALVLGAIAPRASWFLVTYALWLAWASASAIESGWFGITGWMPTGEWLSLALGSAIVYGAATAVLRERIVPLTLVLLAGMLAGEAGLAGMARLANRTPPPAAPAAASHVIHVVFDGQIGIGGFPSTVPEAAAAARLWQETLLRHNFAVFPYAYSNYNETMDSVPSILNDRLETVSHEFVGARNVVTKTGRLAEAQARGLSVNVYQSDFLRFAGPGPEWRVREYAAAAPLPLPSDVATLGERVEILGAWYASFDKVGAALVHRLPSDVRPSPNLWSLNAQRFWPAMLQADVLAAARPTYFFAHLLLPHAPFAFDAAGRLRPRRYWRAWPPAEMTPAVYRNMYREYADQSAFVARQLGGFLDELSRAGVLDHAQVIVHGDHGTRFRLMNEPGGQRTGTPSMSDRGFVDTYSTLLAVRPPGARVGRSDETKGGILRLLRRAEGRDERPAEAEALDAAYDFESGVREPTRFSGHDHWKD